MRNYILITLSLIVLQSCISTKDETYIQLNTTQEPIYLRDNLPIVHKLGFPVGYPDMKGYTDANPFGTITSNGRHLGADLNKPGNSDLGDIIYSIGDGVVVEAYDATIIVKHRLLNNSYILSSYFHCNKVYVQVNDKVKAGQSVGEIGKKYTKTAHLHWEILTDTTKRFGFYGNADYCVDPVEFIYNYNKKVE